MHAAWDELENQLKTQNDTAMALCVQDTYALLFPASLSGPLTVRNRTFTTQFTCPAMTNPISCKATANLVFLLAAELNSSLAASIDLTGTSGKVGTSSEAEAKDDNSPPPPHFAIFGSSHMKRTSGHLMAKGYRVLDLTQKNWFLSKKSVENLANTLPGCAHSTGYNRRAGLIRKHEHQVQAGR